MQSASFPLDQLASQQVDPAVDLVFCGFDRASVPASHQAQLKEKFPNANIVSFSTSGHFTANKLEDTVPLVATLSFDTSTATATAFDLSNFKSSYEIGNAIGSSCPTDSKGLCIISDGRVVNGTELLAGVNETLPKGVVLFGGMAGDGTRFEQTLVGLNGEPSSGTVVAITFAGDNLVVNYSSNGGWTSLGLDFEITKSEGNNLLEINNQNPYDMLRNLLQPENEDTFLYNTLYHPFLLQQEGKEDVIRTPIFIDHENKTLSYAGDMPEGAKVTVMKSGVLRLLDSTMEAAQQAANPKGPTDFVFAVSCVGRRIVLDNMTSEEYTEISSVLGKEAGYFGFYSYGEFGRSDNTALCMLHNQTFTIGTISEMPA